MTGYVWDQQREWHFNMLRSIALPNIQGSSWHVTSWRHTNCIRKIAQRIAAESSAGAALQTLLDFTRYDSCETACFVQ